MRQSIKKAFPLLLALVLFGALTVQATTGTLRGQITDAETGEPLPFVNVVLQNGNAAVVTGATSDLDGFYSIKNIQAGDYTVKVAYIGYRTQEKKVRIEAQRTKVLNIALSSEVQTLEEVVIEQHHRSLISHDAAIEFEAEEFHAPPPPPATTYAKVIPNAPQEPRYYPGNEQYDAIVENEFKDPTKDPLSTFSIDVDAASYANVRRFINENQRPPANAVRIEEMINYFSYDYPNPTGEHPFSITTEMSDCPWNSDHRLVHIGLQGKKLEADQLPPNNLVFLVDVSGSMSSYNKLDLVKKSLRLLVKNMREEDRVSIAVYAGAAGLVLPSTSGADKQAILESLDRLSAGGSTAGGAGIRLAYEEAVKHFKKNGNNRVILCTDGDFNVGISDDASLVKLIEEKRETGVYLTVLGYGMGNYKDSKMEKLADHGNGNYGYIDNIMEAKKMLVTEMGGTLFTIAKDVKLQIEFNPAHVKSYKLIGYENRILAAEDFNDDTKDAGELGAGHTVTALYEIVPAGGKSRYDRSIDPLRYQTAHDDGLQPKAERLNNEVMTVKFRYKPPKSSTSKLITKHLTNEHVPLNVSSNNFKFSAAVAEFGLLLRNSKFKADANIFEVLQLAKTGKGADVNGYRAEFIRLVEQFELQANN